ncbi:MAG: glycosyltransferase [Candidatus Eisenbacteria bacterium]|uniref:Glycosyltransferase n=1 Tax=Eiseniibacteriota bacterium TaxID=2212470 RepID=A0A538T7T7_UNCEI|nr:MAG: glycosyltransferase [Candidatus Eisenbacteria bacterium]
MKVAILGPTYPHRGGIAHYTTLLARALAGRHDLAMISFARLYPGLLFPGTTQFDTSTIRIEPPVRPEPILDSLNPLSWLRAGARLRAIAPDALVVPWWHPFFGPSLGTASRRARPPGRRTARVFLCHNVSPHEATPIDRALTAYGLGGADAFLVHARSEAEKLHRVARGRPIRVHPHPSYEIFSERAPSREEARLALGVEGRVLLFFGYVRPYKGLADLLLALKLARRDTWDCALIVGEFYEPLGRYRAPLEDPSIRARVRLVNRYVANEEVARYFAAADVVALPYREATGSGIAQIAFGAGVPVIATRVGGLEDVVEEGVSGLLVPPGDPPALARAIERFFDGGMAERLRGGVARSRGRFGWDALAGALESLAAECLS